MIPYYRIVNARFPQHSSVVFIDDLDMALWVDPEAPAPQREAGLTAAIAVLQAERRECQLFNHLPDQVV